MKMKAKQLESRLPLYKYIASFMVRQIILIISIFNISIDHLLRGLSIFSPARLTTASHSGRGDIVISF